MKPLMSHERFAQVAAQSVGESDEPELVLFAVTSLLSAADDAAGNDDAAIADLVLSQVAEIESSLLSVCAALQLARELCEPDDDQSDAERAHDARVDAQDR